jgi:hypothetical protein
VDDGRVLFMPWPCVSYLKTDIDKWIADGGTIQEFYTLDTAKTEKITAIDAKTRQLIAQGFTFNNKTFSLSEPAQINWLGMQGFKASLTFPFKVSTIAEEGYELSNLSEFEQFVGTAFSTVNQRKSSGVALREQIMAIYNDSNLSTEEKIDQITTFVDNR